MLYSRQFDKNFFSTGVYKNYKKLSAEWMKPIARRIYRILEGKPGAKILDIGCGFGTLMAELQNRHHFRVEGLDCSLYAVQRAEPSVRKRIRRGSILNLPFSKKTFDAVICFDVTAYLASQDITKAVKNLVEVSKNFIFFSAIYRHSMWASQKINPDKLRVTVLSQKEYIQLFSQNGARFIKKFHGENGGEVLIFKKI